MSLVVSTDVSCDRCQNWAHGDVASTIRGRRARAAVRAHGWERRRVDGRMLDLCDVCAPIVADELTPPTAVRPGMQT